jgi:hypothetical protein
MAGFNLRHLSTFALFTALCCGTSSAQQLVSNTLPDSPGSLLANAPDPASESSSTPASAQSDDAQPAPQSATPPDHSDEQTKRILGIIPNFRAVTAGTKLPPQTIKDKFVSASQDSFDYSSIFLPAALAGIGLAENSVPEFHHGAVGYGRYFWHSAADQTIENYMVEFVVPIIHNEDTRYYTLGKGGFLKRTKYAISHVIITQSDSGHPTFNAGEVIGAGAAAGISSLYYPQSQRSFGQTAQLWGTNIGIDAASFTAREFWPDINHFLFHGKKE